MQRDAGVLREGLEPFPEEFGIHFANFGLGELDLPNEVRAARDVNCDARQGVIHGQMHVGVSGDALFIAQRLGDSLTQHYAGILSRVMEIDVQVAGGFQSNVDH